MPEIVDPKTGKIVNVSQRRANAASESYSEELKKVVSKEATSVSDTNVDATANKAKETFNSANATIGGQVSGAVQGGMQNLQSKVDGYKQQLTDAKDTVTGLLDGDTKSLDNIKSDLVNSAMSAISSKLGTKVSIQFSEPDPETGIVTPITATLDTQAGAGDTIAGILSIITGLGTSQSFTGSLQNVMSDVSPSGLLNSTNLIEGKIGAFTSNTINSLASDAITSVTNEVKSLVTQSLAETANINKEVSYIDTVDSNGNTTTAIAPWSGIGGVASRTDSDEFFTGIGKIDSDGLNDIQTLVTTDKEIKPNVDGLKTELSTLSGGKDGEEVLTSIQTAQSTRDVYAQNVEKYKGLIRNKANNSEVGIIQGISTNTLTTIKQQIKKVAPKISDSDMERLIGLSQGDVADKSEAIKILLDNSGLTFAEAQRFLDSIDTTITSATKLPPDVVILAEPYVIGTYQEQWTKGQGDPVFPYISSTEELQAEVAIIQKSREVNSVIVHWTETHTNKNIGSEEINGWHLKAGLEGIGYHYVCRRDGSLQRGRPVSLDGQHTPGFDANTISFVFVGGINAPTGTPNEQNFLSAQSLTRSQINTFDHFCRAFYNVYPGIKILGHSEVDETGLNVDPGFDVSDYVLTRFGKNND